MPKLTTPEQAEKERVDWFDWLEGLVDERRRVMPTPPGATIGMSVGEAIERMRAQADTLPNGTPSWGGMTANVPLVQTIYVPGWIPASLNKSQGRHWSVKSKSKKADRVAIADAVLFSGIRTHGRKRRCVSMFLILPPGKRCPDDDNLWKNVLDGLVHSLVLFNDSPTWVKRGTLTYARGIVHPGDVNPMGTFIVVEDLV